MASTLQRLVNILQSTSLIDEKSIQEDKGKIAARCYEEFEMDLRSRGEWEQQSKGALEIAKQVWSKKTEPWDGAANVKYPLIAGAAVQFGARAYPAILSGRDIVRTKIVGQDPDGSKSARAARVQKHMNYQLTEQIKDWDEGMDKLLHGLPVLGTMFKKTYWSKLLERPVSELVLPHDLVVNNDTTKDILEARRITHIFALFKNEIIERMRSGIWTKDETILERLNPTGTDEQGPYTVLEQHRWLDLDDDGYEEPYAVTMLPGIGMTDGGVHQFQVGDIVRIVPRYFPEDVELNEDGKIKKINPQCAFSKYTFIPDFCGKFYDVGFGQLLNPLNEAVNGLINQLLDAGTLSNMQSGFIAKGLKVKGGEMRFSPGEFKQVNSLMNDLRGSILPLPYKEPSPTLMNLLTFLVDAGKQLSSVSEVLSGEQSGVNVPATTTLALIEQGLKVFTAINKRVYRGMASEFEIIYYLNARYLSDAEYFKILDEENIIARSDYAMGDCDIYPVADPTNATSTQKLIKAEALMKTMGMPGAADPRAILHKYYEALEIDDLEKFHPEQGPEPPPDPKAEDIKSSIQERQAKLPYEIEKLRTESIKNIALAEAAEIGPQLEQYKLALQSVLQDRQQRGDQELQQQQMDQQAQMQQAQMMQQQQMQQQDQGHQAGMQQQQMMADQQDADATREHEMGLAGMEAEAAAQNNDSGVGA